MEALFLLTIILYKLLHYELKPKSQRIDRELLCLTTEGYDRRVGCHCDNPGSFDQ